MTSAELKQLEADLWRSVDILRANSDLKWTEYSTLVLGLIFLKFADNKCSLTGLLYIENSHVGSWGYQSA
jgi:type I restriction enzyme M protein